MQKHIEHADNQSNQILYICELASKNDERKDDGDRQDNQDPAADPGNARSILRKQRALSEVAADIDSNEVKVKTLLEEYETLESGAGEQDKLEDIKEIRVPA